MNENNTRWKSFKEWLSVTRQWVTELFLISIAVVLVWSLGKELFGEQQISILPVSVPPGFAEQGYSDTLMSRRIAREMLEIGLSASVLLPSESLMEIPTSGYREVADITIPNQDFSFRTLSQFIKDSVGIDNTKLRIDLSVFQEDGLEFYSAQLIVEGGEYDGTTSVVKIPTTVDLETMIHFVSQEALAVIHPYVFAMYLLSNPETVCSEYSDCSLARVKSILHELLINNDSGDDARAHLGWASLYSNVAEPDFEEIFQHCQRAIALDHLLPEPHLYCGLAFYAMSEDDEEGQQRALGYFREASFLFRSNPDVQAALGNQLLGLRKPDVAKIYYERAIKLDRNHYYSLIGLGTSHRQMCKFAESIEFYKSAVLIAPNEPFGLGGLGTAYLLYADYENALTYLERTLEMFPEVRVLHERIKMAQDKEFFREPGFDCPVDSTVL